MRRPEDSSDGLVKGMAEIRDGFAILCFLLEGGDFESRFVLKLIYSRLDV